MIQFNPIRPNLNQFDPIQFVPIGTNFIWIEPNNQPDPPGTFLIQYEPLWTNLNRFHSSLNFSTYLNLWNYLALEANSCNSEKYNKSRASNIAFLLEWAQISDLDFGFIPTEYFYQKGFIPISRVPSFFLKWQVVIKFLYFWNKDTFKLTL